MRYQNHLAITALVATLVAGATAHVTAIAPKGKPTVCKLETVKDPQTGKPAFTYLVPKGWEPRYNMRWLKDPGSFVLLTSAATPDHQYEVTQLSTQIYQFSVYNSINGNAPMASSPPIHHATEYLRMLLGKIVQQEGLSGGEVMDEVNAPISANQVPEWMKKAPVGGWQTRTPANETGFLEVRFTKGDQAVTVMLGTTIKGFSSVNRYPGRDAIAGENGFFVVGPTTFLVKPSDAPASKDREMKVVAGSLRMTPTFRTYLAELTDHLVKIKMGAAVAAAKYASDTFHERTMAQFSDQMRMKDANSHAFCNYVSDLQDFKDQHGRVVTLPASCRYAWADGSGNYLLNDDPTVDMRGLGDGNWKRLEKARIGD